MSIIGIDLGTTNCLVSVWEGDKAILIPNSLGEYLTPSAVSYDKHSRDYVIGRSARERLITYPQETAVRFKRYMGSEHKFKLGKQEFLAEELSAMLLKQLKEDAELYLGEEVSEAIISVPAYFNDTQRQATRLAGKIAGLKIERLINEPTAAALAFGLQNTMQEQTIVVLDLGGGTFDVSVLEVFDNIVEVRATAGDNFLGGEDFTDALLKVFVEQIEGTTGKSISVEDKVKISKKAEYIKHELVKQEYCSTVIEINRTKHTLELSRETFNKICESLIARFRAPVERAIRDSRISISEINDIVLVGGASRMHWIHGLVVKMFGRFPNSSIDPDEVVCRGAAVQAALKARNEALKDVVLTDVCPYSLGVEIVVDSGNGFQGGHFLPIIERNTTVPVSREERLSSVIDNQPRVVCNIYQGESRLTANNIRLGQISANISPGRAGSQFVDIRFTYDINGLLEIQLKVPSSGELKTLLLNNGNRKMTDKEIKAAMAKLSSLKVHPRENAHNKLTLTRLESLYEQSLGIERQQIGEWIQHFERVLQSQDTANIDRTRSELDRLLSDIEGQ